MRLFLDVAHIQYTNYFIPINIQCLTHQLNGPGESLKLVDQLQQLMIGVSLGEDWVSFLHVESYSLFWEFTLVYQLWPLLSFLLFHIKLVIISDWPSSLPIIIQLTSQLYNLMADRLRLYAQIIAQQPKKANKPPLIAHSALDYLTFADYLSSQEQQIRLQLRQMVEMQIQPQITGFVQSASFPDFVVALMRQKGLMRHFVQQRTLGQGSSSMLQGVLIAQLARGDAGLAAFAIMNALTVSSIEEFGSKAQREEIIPQITTLSKVAGTALFDSRNLLAPALIATKTQAGYVLNGEINLTGNGKSNIECLWAKSSQNEIIGFLVEKMSESSSITISQQNYKYGMRILQNSTMVLQNYQSNVSQKLDKPLNLFESKTLLKQRLWICWMIAGICIAVYDSSIRYASQRSQFNRPISGFQLIQQKLVKIMSHTQGVLFTCAHLSKLMQTGELNMVKAGLAKGWACEQAREISRWGRQICGGNGLLHENYSMRALADLEAIYTYAGTNQSAFVAAGRKLFG